MLTEEDKKEIGGIVALALQEEERHHRMLRRELALKNDAENPKQTKLYLITLTGHQIAFPDERGRAILSQCVYARVAMRQNEPNFYGGSLEVVAYGDGKRLKQPRTLILTGGSVVGMVEVPEDVLES
jgi:hypothetical protein